MRRRQGRRTSDQAGIRAVELQPDFTIQVYLADNINGRCSQNVYIYIIFTTRLTLGQCTHGRKGVLEHTGGVEQHSITEAAPNELKLGEGG